MKMYFYRGKYPNFGDELNEWLLPKVFPSFFNDDESTIFLGIGSILSDLHPVQSCKVVFGSGYAGYTAIPKIDQRWKFYCVRGPRTAAALNLGHDKVAGDSAILISKYFKRSQIKPTGYAFMPHWEHIELGNWALACKMAGIRYIDPRAPIDDVLAAIDQSEVLITEALHGAIVADAIRVPWIPVLPLDQLQHMKWFDWAEALDIKFRRAVILPSSVNEVRAVLRPITRRVRPLWSLLKPAQSGGQANGNTSTTFAVTEKSKIGILDGMFTRVAAASLKRAMNQAPMLSTDIALNRAVDRLETQSLRIISDFIAG